MGNGFKKNITRTSQIEELQARVENIENGVQQIVNQVNNALTMLNQKTTGLEDVFKGVARTLGMDVLAKAIADAKTEELNAESAQKQESIQKALQDGKLAVTDVVTERSIILGTETKADGTVLAPTINVVQYLGVNEALRAGLLGKSKGELVPVPGTDGNLFEIVELYDILPEELPTEPETISEA